MLSSAELDHRETFLFQRFQELDEKVARMKMEMQAIETELTFLAQRRNHPQSPQETLESVSCCVSELVVQMLQSPSLLPILLPNPAPIAKGNHQLLKDIIRRAFRQYPQYNANLRNHLITKTYTNLANSKMQIKLNDLALQDVIMGGLLECEHELSPMTSSGVMERFCVPLRAEAFKEYQMNNDIVVEARKLNTINSNGFNSYLSRIPDEKKSILMCYVEEIFLVENDLKRLTTEETIASTEGIFLRIRHGVLPPPPVMHFQGLVVGPKVLRQKFEELKRRHGFATSSENTDYEMDELPSIHEEQEHQINNELMNMIEHHLPFLYSYVCMLYEQ